MHAFSQDKTEPEKTRQRISKLHYETKALRLGRIHSLSPYRSLKERIVICIGIYT